LIKQFGNLTKNFRRHFSSMLPLPHCILLETQLQSGVFKISPPYGSRLEFKGDVPLDVEKREAGVAD